MSFIQLYVTFLSCVVPRQSPQSPLGWIFCRPSPNLANPGQFSLCGVFLFFIDSYPGVVLIPAVVSPVGAALLGPELSPDSPDWVVFLARSLSLSSLSLITFTQKVVIAYFSWSRLVLSLRGIGLSRFLFARCSAASRRVDITRVCAMQSPVQLRTLDIPV